MGEFAGLAIFFAFCASLFFAGRWSRATGWRRWIAIGFGLLVVLFVVQRVISPGDQQEIEDVIERVATTTDPGYCDEYLTEDYLEHNTGGEAPYADELCEAFAGETAADSVEVSDIEVDGDTAYAEVEQHGGSFDGSTLVLELAKDDGDWKLDKLLGFATFDRPGFEEAYRQSYVEFGSSRTAVECALGRVSKMSNAEIRTDLLSDDLGVFRWLPVICDRQGLVDGYIETLRDDPAAPRDLVSCAAERYRRATDERLVHLTEDLIANDQFLAECGEDLFFTYFARTLTQDDIDTQQANCIVAELRGQPFDEAMRLSFDDGRYADLIDDCD